MVALHMCYKGSLLALSKQCYKKYAELGGAGVDLNMHG